MKSFYRTTKNEIIKFSYSKEEKIKFSLLSKLTRNKISILDEILASGYKLYKCGFCDNIARYSLKFEIQNNEETLLVDVSHSVKNRE
jgi:hypothetical protein